MHQNFIIQIYSFFDYSSKCKCEGGPATTCISHVPFVVDGCDDIRFAYGVLPSGIPNYCGKCFLLEFTGEGSWTTKAIIEP